jgi:hypothetical protein
MCSLELSAKTEFVLKLSARISKRNRDEFNRQNIYSGSFDDYFLAIAEEEFLSLKKFEGSG